MYSASRTESETGTLALHSEPNGTLALHSDPNERRNGTLALHSHVVDRNAGARARSSNDARAPAPTDPSCNSRLCPEKGGAGGAEKKARREEGRSVGPLTRLPSSDPATPLSELLRLGVGGDRARILCESGVTIEMIRAIDQDLNGVQVRSRAGVLAKRLADALGVTLPRSSRASVAPDVAAAQERIRQLRASMVQSRGLEARLSRGQGSRDTRSSPC